MNVKHAAVNPRATTCPDLAKTVPRRQQAVKLVAPVLGVLLVGAVAMGYFNWRVRGDPLSLPYQVNRATYAVTSVFLWSEPTSPPKYNHEVMRDFYVNWEPGVVAETHSTTGFLELRSIQFFRLWDFFVGPVISIPLLMIPWVVRDRRIRPLLAPLVSTAAAISVTAWISPHYLAPIMALLYCLLIQSARHLWVWRRTRGTGSRYVCSMPVICAASVVLCVIEGPSGLSSPFEYMSRCTHLKEGSPLWHRQRILRRLEATQGRHLVFVRYSKDHVPQFEWVYNHADIDKAKVVWARGMGPEHDKDLAEYFRDRAVWLLEADSRAPKLEPHPGWDEP